MCRPPPSPLRLTVVLVALGLAACSTLERTAAPDCHGPRRPANPHGSVLAPAAAPSAEPPAPQALAPSAGGCVGARP